MSRMRRPSYRDGIEWIAGNDEPTEMDSEAVLSQLTVMLLADMFGVEAERVARDVVRLRSREDVVSDVMTG